MKNSEKPINLHEYLEKYRTPMTVIAYRSGLTFHQVYNIFRGGCPTLKTAISLEKFSDGEMSCESLLPEKMRKDIETNKYTAK